MQSAACMNCQWSAAAGSRGSAAPGKKGGVGVVGGYLLLHGSSVRFDQRLGEFQQPHGESTDISSVLLKLPNPKSPGCPRRGAAPALHHWQLPPIAWCRQNDSGYTHPHILYHLDSL